MPYIRLSATIRPTNLTIFEDVWVPDAVFSMAEEDDDIESLVADKIDEWLAEAIHTDHQIVEDITE